MYRSLLVLTAALFAIGTDSFVIAGILPEAAHSLDVSVGTAGWLISAYAFTYAILGPVMAAFTARWSRRTLFLTGLGIFVVGNLLTGLVPDFGVALAARALAGLGGAMVTPTAIAAAATIAPPERRGRAIATVTAGLSASTALGAPIGTAIGSLTGDWRATMLFVSTLGLLAAAGIALLMPKVPSPPPVPLRARLAPLGDRRIGLTLLTTLLLFTGLYTVYSYIAESLDRATGGSGTTLAVLLFAWGVASTTGTLGAGHLVDRLGDRRIINITVAVLAVDFALLPWSSAQLSTTVIALVVWGLCGWGFFTPQAHRLISVMPASAPMLTGLNSATLYVGVSLAPLVGQAGIAWTGAHWLGPIGAVLILASLATAERAHAVIRRHTPHPATQAQPATSPASTERGCPGGL
ncbi:MFS transporter [Streptomyces sp. NPDC007157]|uniref:MFS transporter n=1 Tax=Streptomyces sp. NPDC007157 TaxID=3154681 RepID=UPI00340E5E87